MSTCDELVLKHMTFSHQIYALFQSSDSRSYRSKILKSTNLSEFQESRSQTSTCMMKFFYCEVACNSQMHK